MGHQFNQEFKKKSISFIENMVKIDILSIE